MTLSLVPPLLAFDLMPGSSADEFMSRLAAADPDAVSTLYARHHAEVRAFARRMLDDDAAAEDVVHDAFVALPAAIARFRGDASLRTFLISIAVNLCRRRIRSATRARAAVSRLGMEPRAEGPTSPEHETRRQWLAALLREGLETLSVDHREAFVLCVVEERSSPEVAAILGVPEGTVRTRVFHARGKLRAYLAERGAR